ncbi:unnamed protein product, partial [Polarella glacialis]
DELKEMRARDLRRELQALGLNIAGLVGREQLVALLESEGAQALRGVEEQVQTPPVVPQEAQPSPQTAEPQKEAPAKEEAAEQKSPEPLDVQQRMSELRAMRARDLIRELKALGLRTEGCVDKDALLELLEAQGLAALEAKEAKAKVEGPQSGTSEKKPTACSPKSGRTSRRLFMKRAVDQSGATAAGDNRVITLDLEIAAASVRFMLDTATYHSIITERAARALGLPVKDLGLPEWAKDTEMADSGFRQVSLGTAALGDIDCGELQIAMVSDDLPVPPGTAGILSLDFLSLFDWDFDITNKTAEAVTMPTEQRAPLPFDVASLRSVPLKKVRSPSGADLFACGLAIRRPGGSLSDPGLSCMGLPDIAACRSMLTQKAASDLNITPDEYIQE